MLLPAPPLNGDTMEKLAAQLADLTVICSDGPVFWHRALLAAWSPFLREVLVEPESVLLLGDFPKHLVARCFSLLCHLASPGEMLSAGGAVRELCGVLHISAGVDQAVNRLLQVKMECEDEPAFPDTKVDVDDIKLQELQDLTDTFSDNGVPDYQENHGYSDSQILAYSKGIKKSKPIHTLCKPVVCSYCQKTFRKLSLLKNHERLHTGEKPYSCTKCSKTYSGKSDLNYHMKKIHLGINPHLGPHTCSQCQKCFSTKGTLRAHARLHTGENTFVCPQCGKEFAIKSRLDKHLYVHSEERRFSCHLCSNSFKHKAALDNHVKVHDDVKAYLCNKCGKSFRYKGNLTQHTTKLSCMNLQG